MKAQAATRAFGVTCTPENRLQIGIATADKFVGLDAFSQAGSHSVRLFGRKWGALTMPESVRVSCIRKRGSHYDPHERIERLGGFHSGLPWSKAEAVIITELEMPEYLRPYNYYVTVNGQGVWVIVANHKGRKYLKTQADGYAPNNLLNLPDCP